MRIFLILTAFLTQAHALEAVREFEITFELEPAFFVEGDRMVIVVDESIRLYQDGKFQAETAYVEGQGPGEFACLQGMAFHGKEILLWDNCQQRMVVFSENLEYRRMEKHVFTRASLLVGAHEDTYVFKWLEWIEGKDKTFGRDVIGLVQDGNRTAVAEVEGRRLFAPGGNRTWNLSKPCLVAAYSKGICYTANHQEYRICVWEIEGKGIREIAVLEQNIEQREWDWDIWEPDKTIYSNVPDYVPPLYHIAADGKDAAVITNAEITKGRSAVDIWKNHQYRGTVSLPQFHFHREIVPILVFYPKQIYFDDDVIYGRHHDEEEDTWTITGWKVAF